MSLFDASETISSDESRRKFTTVLLAMGGVLPIFGVLGCSSEKGPPRDVSAEAKNAYRVVQKIASTLKNSNPPRLVYEQLVKDAEREILAAEGTGKTVATTFLLRDLGTIVRAYRDANEVWKLEEKVGKQRVLITSEGRPGHDPEASSLVMGGVTRTLIELQAETLSALSPASKGGAGYPVEGKGTEVDLLRVRRMIWTAAAERLANL